ncbi:unnamed protein product [Prorocentrum cordatum]|uniref:Spatacsin C-terminal domain-containing protein n=1 Tax=Prorocentrum cordatum TaxID=2364126 RepID=A0ABN9RYP1_9DINO|nr:unnamed protein product [Polarella glacialis]
MMGTLGEAVPPLRGSGAGDGSGSSSELADSSDAGAGADERPGGRRRVAIGRLSLSITSSHVCCEIWERPGEGGRPEGPWGLAVIARPPSTQRSSTAAQAQIDHLTGSLLETLGDSRAAGAGQQVVVFRSRRPWRSLVTQNQIWYMLSEGVHLHALILNQPPARIISNLLVFESRAKASKLCALNGWNAKQLPVLTLFLGLRFRKLQEIRQSLGLLRPDQEMEACQMIMDFIHAGYSCASLLLPFSPSPQPVAMVVPAGGPVREPGPSASQLPADRSFVSRLLEISMQFVTKLIQTRVAQIQECEGACRALTYLQPKHAASEPPQYASMVHELSQLTVHMQALRGLQQQLIRSFGDDKAYDSGIVISCPPQAPAADQLTAGDMKTGMASLDAAVSLATRLQAGGDFAAKDRVSEMAKLRGGDSAESIVRGALISGRVSSALNWFHELALQDGSSAAGASRVFEEFRVTAGRLAYQLVCNQQLDFLFVAIHMLRNVGESVNRFFRALAFHTSKRLVRRRLLRHLHHMGRLTDSEQSLISLVNVLERLYTNPCYTTEFNRMTTGLVTGQYPQRAHSESSPPFCTWPAGGRRMLQVGLQVDGAIGGHVGVDTASEDLAFEQQTSLRELPMSQRMPLELYDMWAGYQTPVMAAMLEMPGEARRAWGHLPCGDIDDLDAQPVLGLSNFLTGSNLDKGQEMESVADFADDKNDDVDVLQGSTAQAAKRTTCRQCRLEVPHDDLEAEELSQNSGIKGATEFYNALGVGEDDVKRHTFGYLHVTLSWMTTWSWDTRARIIMEKTHYWPEMVESLEWLRPPASAGPPDCAWRNCWLDFLVAHQDWRGLASWVRNLPLRLGNRADDHGRSRVDLTHLEERGLPYCTSYTKEVVLQELGRRGLFCRGDVQSFSALLRRLAQCGRLFGDFLPVVTSPAGASDDADGGALLPAEGALPLDRLLPRRVVCPFHRFFIHFCIDRDLPTAMLLYLQKYELATRMGDLKALQLRHAERSWASLLLVGRLGNAHLFAASLQHAATVFAGEECAPTRGGSRQAAWQDAERVYYMPLNSLAAHSPVAFLATLMFAPVASGLDAAGSPQAVPWHVEVGQFHQVVQEYPALHEAFFPAGLPPGGPPPPSGEQGAADPGLATSLVEAVADANCARWASGRPDQRSAQPVDGGGGGGHSWRLKDGVKELGLAAAGANEKLQHTLDDMTTFKEDVSLSTLLGDVAAFDVREGLKPLPIFGKQDSDGAATVGNLSTLVAPGEKFRDELGEGYFLAQGRAMMALHVLLTKCDWRMEQRGELRREALVLPAQDARRLHKVAKSVALHNLLNEGVVSSSVCLLELCSLETEMLRVDVQAAKRIYEHLVLNRRGAGGEDGDVPRSAAASVIELFLSFPDIEDADAPSRAAEAAINSGHLLTALRMLEESTWALDPHPSAPTVSSLQALAYDSPWHLVALFCRVHSLPRSLTLLHELARNNDWVMFLHESDLQQCPGDTVLDIVDGYFTDVPLQSHMRNLAYSIAAQERSLGRGLPDRADRKPADRKPDELSEPRAEEAAQGSHARGADRRAVDAIGLRGLAKGGC